MISESYPLRVSLFGGGTDYPEWFAINGGFVIGGAINLMVTWGIDSDSSPLGDAEANILSRSCEFFDFSLPSNVFTNSNEFVGKGLGASSASLAALFTLLHRINNIEISKSELISQITYFERFVLGKNVGVQDQIFTVEQRFCAIDIRKGGKGYDVLPIINQSILNHLNSNLYLVHTGVNRQLENISKCYTEHGDEKNEKLMAIHGISKGVWQEFGNSFCLKDFALALDKTWSVKKKVAPLISDPIIDDLYYTAKSAGAFGGKLLGAGGGGYLLLVIEDGSYDRVSRALSGKKIIPVSFLA